MLPIYLFAAVFGGGLLLIGMIGGDADTVDADVDMDVEAGSELIGWKSILSFQTAAYALAGFGLTGAALGWLGVPALATLALAAALGVLSGTVIGALFGWLKRNQSGFAEPSDRYIGGIGTTEVRIPRDGQGRIEVVHRGRAFTLPAVTHAGEIDRHETVVIVDVVDGIAVVDRAPRELTL
jgi:membrane protein implicated in regulation of membrane protease activity